MPLVRVGDPLAMTATKRGWSFSLRTLFVVVTMAGCWLAYHVNWIHQRHALQASGQVEVVGRTIPAPGLLGWLGEPGHEAVFLYLQGPTSTPDENREIESIRRLFPEADVGWPFQFSPDAFPSPKLNLSPKTRSQRGAPAAIVKETPRDEAADMRAAIAAANRAAAER